MKLILTSDDWQFADEIFQLFKIKPGSERMATEFALAHLSAVLRLYKPETVIEYGAGIGTVTYALLSHPAGIKQLITTEENDFCLAQLDNNIPIKFKPRLKVISKLSELKKIKKKCDLILFDGGFNSPEELKFLKKGSVCFIEGARKHTRQQISELLEKQNLRCAFQNYHQGYKYFHFFDSYDYKKGIKTKKFKFRGKLKGCWLGEVAVLNG